MIDKTRVIADGGPAFPGEARYVEGAGMVTVHGMSLRDWFAGQALAGLLGTKEGWDADNSDLVTSAFEIADAMLARRKEAGR